MKANTRFLGILLFVFATAAAIAVGLPHTASAVICCYVHNCEPPCNGEDWTGHLVAGQCICDGTDDCDHWGYCFCP